MKINNRTFILIIISYLVFSFGIITLSIKNEKLKIENQMHYSKCDLVDTIITQNKKINRAMKYLEHTVLFEIIYDEEGYYVNANDDKATRELLEILEEQENE